MEVPGEAHKEVARALALARGEFLLRKELCLAINRSASKIPIGLQGVQPVFEMGRRGKGYVG